MTPKEWAEEPPTIPHIGDHDNFPNLLRKLSLYFVDAIQTPHSFEELRTVTHSKQLLPLINYISDSVHNQAIVCALLALKSHFSALDPDDDRGLNVTRGYACEFVAWRFVTHLSGREAIDFLLYELPSTAFGARFVDDEETAILCHSENEARSPDYANERTPFSDQPENPFDQIQEPEGFQTEGGGVSTTNKADEQNDNFAASFQNLNALEIAAVSDAKKFLSQRVVQRIIESIWRGEIIFWETLSVDSVKDAKVYNKKKADPFSRLRVPLYLKVFEAIFFLTFLGLYYAVLIPIQRNGSNRPSRPGVPPFSVQSTLHSAESERQHSFHSITTAEVLLYIWILSFAYDEFGDYRDAGQAFYSTDFWSVWDLAMVLTGIAFFITRMVGLVKADDSIIGVAFDILALEALFLVPRICSLLSLNPYFGTLIPCLREMTKDFIKFLSLVAILYLGFLTTFTLLARDNFTLREMSWILVKVFFGSSYLGFDVAHDISPLLGPPLMLIFVCMTNILLITSLISLLSNSLTRILAHAKEEFLFIYSVYVLEASTSNRLTYFLPPLNLIPLLLRPLRLCVSTEQLRRTRIVLLKITHSPYVAAIWLYEGIQDRLFDGYKMRGSGVTSLGGPVSSASMKRSSYLRNSLYTPRTLVAASLSQGSLHRAARAGRSTATLNPRPATRSNEPLEALVLRLSSQVEELTAMVAEQQRGQADGPMDIPDEP